MISEWTGSVGLNLARNSSRALGEASQSASNSASVWWTGTVMARAVSSRRCAAHLGADFNSIMGAGANEDRAETTASADTLDAGPYHSCSRSSTGRSTTPLKGSAPSCSAAPPAGMAAPMPLMATPVSRQ